MKASLVLCVDSGVDAPHLRDRFAYIHDVDRTALNRFSDGGTYRSELSGLPRPEFSTIEGIANIVVRNRSSLS